jgi:parallel beta-helix repeat protein
MKKIFTAALLALMAVSFSATITWRGNVSVTDFTVEMGDILVIEAGTKVRFAYQGTLTVQGEIMVMGEPNNPVLFSNAVTMDSSWNGILVDFSTGNNQFNHSIFTGTGETSLVLLESNVLVNNCIFKNNGGAYGGAIQITGGNVTIDGSLFAGNNSSYAGAIYIFNDSQTGLSEIQITNSRFEGNEGLNGTGALYIQDRIESPNNMHITVSKCVFAKNEGQMGGAVYYDNKGKIDLKFEKSKIFSNKAFWGSAIYMKFREFSPGPILAQKFTNLLIFKNGGYSQSGIYINMGETQNPQDFNFTNATIAYNSIIMPPKDTKQDYTSGIYIKAHSGKFPQIRNTILWQNTNDIGESNFFLEGEVNLGTVFRYCDIGGFPAEQPNISEDPIFVRSPQNSVMKDFDIDSYDFHLSVLSPCANAGDPMEPCTELNSTRVDMGAYGNTMESVRPYSTINAADVNTNLMIPGGQAVVLDFQGKAIKANWNELVLNSNSEIYIKAAYNADFSFKKLIANTKFDGGVVRIHTLAETSSTGQKATAPQELVIEESVSLSNANFNDVKLKFQKNTPMTASVTLNNTKFFTKDGTMPYAIEIIEADDIYIENSKFLNFANGGIKIGADLPVNKTKASGRISNNTVSFDASESTKDKAGKRVGLEVANAHMDVENNSIEGGDEGIVMKTNSSGRITNNTVSFDASESTKGFTKKAISVSGNSTPSEVSNNSIFSYDNSSTSDVIGIEIDNSVTDIIGNKMYYGSSPLGVPRTAINLLSPSGTVRIINNTIYNPYTAVSNSIGASPKTIQIINNVYWSDNDSINTITDTTKVAFFNNCFIDSTDITGSGNIFVDPKIYYAWEGDFSLASTSPCINAGTIVEGIHTGAYESKVIYYYGTAPDMGAEETYQELTAPSNVTTEISGGNITFGWDEVPGYPYYKVYASDDPYGTFSVVEHFSNRSYTTATTAKKFFYIVATTEPPTKIYTSDTAGVAEVKNVAPKPERKSFKINRNTLKR